MDHWTFSDGPCSDGKPSVLFQNVEAADSEYVKVNLMIVDGECSQNGGVLMVKENDEWKIDDFFIRGDDDSIISEKNDDIKGIKSAGLDYLLNPHCSRPSAHPCSYV